MALSPEQIDDMEKFASGPSWKQLGVVCQYVRILAAECRELRRQLDQQPRFDESELLQAIEDDKPVPIEFRRDRTITLLDPDAERQKKRSDS